MEQVLIFANPIAGRGRGRAIAEQLHDYLQTRGYDVRVFLSKADSVGWKPSEENIRAAIVIGGDGTLRGVAQWAVDTSVSSAQLPFPLLIVPMGTANVMGRHLGIAWDHKFLGQEVAEAMEHRHIVNLDAARTRGGLFLLMAGIGFDAWVVHELCRIRSGPISLASYILPTLRAIKDYSFPALEIFVDGKRVFERAPAFAIVGNVPEYAIGLTLLPHARPDDGLLDVCVLPCSSWQDLARLFMPVVAGEHLAEEGVVYVQGRHIHVESIDPVPVQVDGEPAGHTPIDIDLLPMRIPFIVPPK
jgi:diacylglycerol kinase family enzyme